MTHWRIDTPGAAPENHRIAATETEALAMQAELMQAGARCVVVWETGPAMPTKVPETHVTGVLSAATRVRGLLGSRALRSVRSDETKGTA